MKENNINIAEILKDCPAGFELYSPLWGTVHFAETTEDCIRVYYCINEEKEWENFDLYGHWYDNRGNKSPEQLLFPSKENRDWSTFTPPKKYKHFEPFQKVLVKCHEWGGDFYSHFCEESNAHVTITGFDFNDDDIIPYEGNEDKLGKKTEP